MQGDLDPQGHPEQGVSMGHTWETCLDLRLAFRAEHPYPEALKSKD